MIISNIAVQNFRELKELVEKCIQKDVSWFQYDQKIIVQIIKSRESGWASHFDSIGGYEKISNEDWERALEIFNDVYYSFDA